MLVVAVDHCGPGRARATLFISLTLNFSLSMVHLSDLLCIHSSFSIRTAKMPTRRLTKKTIKGKDGLHPGSRKGQLSQSSLGVEANDQLTNLRGSICV